MTTQPPTTAGTFSTPATARPTTAGTSSRTATAPSTTTGTSSTTRTTNPTSRSTRVLLGAGVLAGPIFVGTAVVQVVSREGFDLTHQPLSLLSLGDLGWIQITNFVLAGLLILAFAVGVARRVTTRPGHVWGPRLFAVFGIGLVMGGVFVADPALGFPVGTPDTIPDSLTWHGLLHAVAPPVAFLALIGACFVLARRFGADGHRSAAVVSRLVGVGCLLLSVPGPAVSVRLFAGITLAFAWIAAVAVYLIVTSVPLTPLASTPLAARRTGRPNQSASTG
jgi:Protein of unknown function (DUF998)